MKVDILPVFGDITAKQLRDKLAVVFDVLRATSTIITALANGCREVIPVLTVEEALAYAGYHRDVILGGERDSLLIPGFHLGNSPREFTSGRVKGKTVVLTTTNGTQAIRRAARGSAGVLIGSLLNSKALAEKIAGARKDVVLICAGTRGSFSLEDTVAAGMVCRELAMMVPVKKALLLESDFAVAACRLADFYSRNPLLALYNSRHGQELAAQGFSEDLAYCSQLNFTCIVPDFRQGRIIAGTCPVT
ncbi:MAG: putative 2-phosphosulfolactate phosphatase [Firmicutes bacterium ADurb.Bin456]|nr:MAG: putative 2-phosphosulfolactate phosphatase [Firmicutes bacterium ADurb.Bin456]